MWNQYTHDLGFDLMHIACIGYCEMKIATSKSGRGITHSLGKVSFDISEMNSES